MVKSKVSSAYCGLVIISILFFLRSIKHSTKGVIITDETEAELYDSLHKEYKESRRSDIDLTL
jgi:hypothetical protein